MLISYSKKIALVCALLLITQGTYALSSNSKNDYYPLYKTRDPHELLHTRTKEQLHGREDAEEGRDMFGLCLTPFGQNAEIGRNIDDKQTQLGSLTENWGMIPLLMGDFPKGQTLPETLANARSVLYPTVPVTQSGFEKSSDVDCNQKFGFFEFPGIYRKRGFRFELAVSIVDDLGITIEGGFSDINFTVTGCYDCPETESCCSDLDTKLVNENLMCKLDEIACDLGLNLNDFHESSVEDMCFSLYWRHAYEINEDREGWPRFLFIPFIIGSFSIAAGKEKEPCRAFGLPFGNNGHNAAGVRFGTNLDFSETVEIGWEVGITHFFEHCFKDLPVPTSTLQRGIFPFKTNTTIRPGFNWHFGLKLGAYHFLDKLSFYFQWIVMEHKNDEIQVADCDPAFKTKAMEQRSGWKAQLFNTALNYDISPHVSLGFAWQAPLSQRNVFRSSSILFGLNFVF